MNKYLTRWVANPVRSTAGPAKRHDLSFVHRFQTRLHDRRFWVVQILVIGISVGHTVLEATGGLGVLPDIAPIPVSSYFIPVVYAALNFGVEGAVPTALWSALLTVPNLILWHTGAERAGVAFQLALLVAIAFVIARRVDFETAAKERAEAANARLERLNLTAAASAESLDRETVLSQTLRAMIDPGKSQSSWILLAPDDADGECIMTAATASAPTEIGAGELAATRSVISEPLGRDDGAGKGTVREDRMAIVPLRVLGAIAGAIGLATPVDALSADDVKLLEAVGNQLGVALGNIRSFRQTQFMVTELSQAQKALQDYVRLATDAQEEERKRLARELHDDTIQTMVIARAELDALAVEKPVSEAVGARLHKVDEMLTAAIDNVRRFSRDLRPSLLDDLGLVDAIDWLVGDLRARTTINAQLRVDGEPRRLSQREELALFRIVQEALHNVERHAEAKTAKVLIDFGQEVRATVVDDGRSFETSEALAGHGSSTRLGLLGMRERAKLIGATLSIENRPLSGTRVTVSLKSTD